MKLLPGSSVGLDCVVEVLREHLDVARNGERPIHKVFVSRVGLSEAPDPEGCDGRVADVVLDVPVARLNERVMALKMALTVWRNGKRLEWKWELLTLWYERPPRW